MAAILQFWTDEASIADGKLFGGRLRPVSALAEYVMNAVNPVARARNPVLNDVTGITVLRGMT